MWSESEITALRQHYPHCTSDQIARILGKSRRAVESYARRIGLKKAQTIVEICLERAKAKRGVAVCEIPVPAKRACQALRRLADSKRLHRREVTHKNVRYFYRRSDADAWFAAEKIIAPPVIIRRNHNRAWWPADAPMVLTPETKVTQCPGWIRSLRTNTHSQM